MRWALESDSTEAIELVLGGHGGCIKDEKIIEECRQVISRNWSTSINHIGREGNRVADMIAK